MKIRSISMLCGLACFVAVFAQALPAAAQEKLSLADIIERTEPSCVRLDVTLRDGSAIGSGFVVSREGWVVTNYHVVGGATKAVARFADGHRAEVEGFLVVDKRRDVAVLKIKTDRRLTPLPLATSLPRKGETAIAIGAPQGLSFTASEGIISAIRKGAELKEFGQDSDGMWLQTSTPISPGSSGGPLLNLRGEVLGANTGSLASAQNLNFAISSEDITLVMNEATKKRVQDLAKLDPPPTRRSPRPGSPTTGEVVVAKLPAERRFGHRFTIAKEEDEFDKVVWLRTQWMPLTHNRRDLKSCGLRIGIPYREDSPAPAVMWELGTTARSFAFLGHTSRRFQLLVDGESIELSDPKHKGDILRGGGVSEKMTTLLRLDGFLKLVTAKEVKARIGTLQFQLSDDQLECLRDLASRLPTGETGLEDLINIRVERYDLPDDPTLPPALAKKLKAKAEREKKDKPKPPADAETRTWTSSGGKYTIDARLVRVEDGKVYLKRQDNSREIAVPLKNLSEDDQQYAKRFE